MFALLVGIDRYMDNLLPDETFYLNLRGCVRDILTVEEFLLSRLGLAREHIFKLTATVGDGPEPVEPREQWPTYENITSAFRKITTLARPGDQVYIHYSGHGGRATSAFPELKGPGVPDEVLVPTDISDSEARYLRDVELAHLLDRMVGKGLYVTVVLDSCHAGGATRGMAEVINSGAGEVRARGAGVIDTTVRPTASAVASDEELSATWRRLGGAPRGVKPGSGWLVEPQGYVLIAACRASEFAYEFPFDGQRTSGALTYWFLDSLKQLGPTTTYKMLHERILPKVHSQFVAQTPQLQGEGDRVVFGAETVLTLPSAGVMRVAREESLIQLDAGAAQGIETDAQFAVYPPGATDLTRAENRLALVEVMEVGETDSWAKLVRQFGAGLVEQGCRALMIDPGTMRLRRAVRVVARDDADGAAAARQVAAAVARGEDGFVRAATGDEQADFQVDVNDEGEFVVRDSAGIEVPNLRPPLAVSDADAPRVLLARLAHLAKYRNVRELDNCDPSALLARKLVVEVAGKQFTYGRGARPNPRPFDEPGNTYTLEVGEWIFVRVRNDYTEPLNVAVLNLRPDWGITQVFPAGAALFEHFDPGQEVLLPLQAGLPEGYDAGEDIIKVFATTGACNFRWLELPALDQLRRDGLSRGRPSNRLEELLAAVAVERPHTRNMNPALYTGSEWLTLQIEVTVRRPGPRRH